MEKTNKQNNLSLMGTTTQLPIHKKNPSGNLLSSDKSDIPNMRSKLSNATFIKWLRSRFQSSLPKRFPYLYFPHELTRETSIEQIFVQFDSDGSGGLSRDEVYDMFRGFGINITMWHLNELYDSVEVNLQQLDCEMFKKCALSQQSNKVFREIVRQLQFQTGSITQQQKQYLPHNFTNMIIYLVYLSKRSQLKQQIERDKIPIQQKVQNIENLLKLKDLSLNNQRLTLYTQNMKRTIKNKFRDIWQKVNESHGQKFSLTPKLEEQFYRFYHKKQSIPNTSKTIVTSRKLFEKDHKLNGKNHKLNGKDHKLNGKDQKLNEKDHKLNDKDQKLNWTKSKTDIFKF